MANEGEHLSERGDSAGARTPSSAREERRIDETGGRGRPRSGDTADEGVRAPAETSRQGVFLDPKLAFNREERWHNRGYLPHFDDARIVQFVTFRLGDSLPKSVHEKLRSIPENDTIARWRETEAALDSGYGSALLKVADCARIVMERLFHDEGAGYDLHAWCLMPNHAHVLLHVREGHSLAKIVAAWKSVSTRLIREIHPEAPARLWQQDYFDRFIRDADHYAKTVAYIRENPVKAGLVKKAEDWPWCDAGARTPSSARETKDIEVPERDDRDDPIEEGGRGRPRSGNTAGEAAHAPGAKRHESFETVVRARPPALPALRARLLAPLEERAAKALERKLVARPEVTPWRNLADNDYLGLSRDTAVIAAGKAALDRWGASSAASPLITGYTEEHAALERELAEWCGFTHGLVWNTGFAANAAVLGTLPKPGDLVFADRLIHASMISGILTSGARLVRYGHNDLEKLRELLEKHRDHAGVLWVVTESVFSMDGDYPDLKTLASLKAEYGFVLVVDEAHATGWFGATGAGLVEREGIAGAVDILVGTLGKGLGGMGAYTLFHDEVFRRHLMNFAGEFVYSTYLAPVNAACARAAIRRVKEIHAEAQGGRGRPRPGKAGEDGRAPAEISRRWHEALRAVVPDTPEGDSPVIPVPLGDSARVMEVAAKLLAAGWKVGAVRPPTVPEGGARLRISLRLGLHENAPAEFAGALRDALK